MCSLSWHRQDSGYEVFFNRDEKKTRGRATPPMLGEINGVRFLCPRDSNAGGTWLLANEYGVTLALLNYWDTDPKALQQPYSRGRLLTDFLATERSAHAVLERLRAKPLSGYGSFTLVAFDWTQANAPVSVRWNGAEFHSVPPDMPLCSSSYRPCEVVSARQGSFAALADRVPSTLWQWHTVEAQPSAFTVRMNRPDAQTWSISRVTVSRSAIHWLYLEEMPDLASAPQAHELTLTLA